MQTVNPRKRPLSTTAYVQRTKPVASEPRYRAYVVTCLGTYDTRAEALMRW